MKTHVPRKRFGQHFLHDPRVIARIVAAIEPRPAERLVEIGPGQAALSRPLLAAGATLEVIEIDRDLVTGLEALAGQYPHLRVHSADALEFPFRALCPDGGRLRIVGNLPYNIATPLLFHLITQIECIEDMTFMVQKEVASRMAAMPGDFRFGRLSVMLQYHCRTNVLFDVGPGAFKPPPRVQSSIVQLRPAHRTGNRAAHDLDRLQAIVTAAFSARRKTLRNALRAHLSVAQIAGAGIDPALRPEMLAVDDYVRLANTGP